MRGRLLIYGATGYTGRLVAERAVQIGLDMMVAGRDAGRTRELAGSLGVESRVFDVDDAGAVRDGLRDVDCVLNVAGPFRYTARQLMDAAIEAGVHYLDTTAEFEIFALAESKDAEASRAGVMVMSGTGWDVVPSDSLALHTARRVADAENIEVFLGTDAGFPDVDPANQGPTEEERSQGRYLAIAEVTGRNGQVTRSLIDTPTGYTFTQLSSVEIARRVLDGQFTAGFQSPASAYGPELATSIADTTIVDL